MSLWSLAGVLFDPCPVSLCFFKCQPKQGSIDDCDVVQGMKKMEAGSFMPRYCVLLKCVSCVYKETAVKYVTQLGVNVC